MANDNIDHNLNEYVTGMVGGQLFGLPIRRVQDVFIPDRLTRVPLAQPEIAGVLNLRGRIVTLIDLRLRLGLDRRNGNTPLMAVGVESRSESYGLLIDSIGEVLKFDNSLREPNPINLDPRLASVSSGIYRMDGQLLIVLDVDRVLDISPAGTAPGTAA